MAHRQGQRVEYRDSDDEKQVGMIEEVSGSGQNALYTIRNERTQQQDECMDKDIERELK